MGIFEDAFDDACAYDNKKMDMLKEVERKRREIEERQAKKKQEKENSSQ